MSKHWNPQYKWQLIDSIKKMMPDYPISKLKRMKKINLYGLYKTKIMGVTD